MLEHMWWFASRLEVAGETALELGGGSQVLCRQHEICARTWRVLVEAYPQWVDGSLRPALTGGKTGKRNRISVACNIVWCAAAAAKTVLSAHTTYRRRRFIASQGTRWRQTFDAVCSTALRVLAVKFEGRECRVAGVLAGVVRA